MRTRPALERWRPGTPGCYPDGMGALVLRLFLPEGQPAAFGRLQAMLPSMRRTPLGLEVPLGEVAPEEILALCLRAGLTARATRIVERTPSG
jgi:hypothetical protein